MHHKRIVVFTEVSVYLVEQSENGDYVVGRSEFGGHGNSHDYQGPVTSGRIVVGKPLSFRCECLTGVHFADGTVHSLEVTRIVEHTLRPARAVPEGYMDITPTWGGALRLLVELREWKGLQDMALAADRYVAAVSLGLLTQSDLEDIEARRTR